MTRVSTFGFPRTAATGAVVAAGTGAAAALVGAVKAGAASVAAGPAAAGAAVGAGARVAVGGTGATVALLPQATAVTASNMINEETRTFPLKSHDSFIRQLLTRL
jgi:uncharacterized 2Fe-2S/4Fe-4S cluster protein (DUF4445 family)